MIKLTAPDGKKLRDTRTNTLHSEVITSHPEKFVVAESDADPEMQTLDGVTLSERVNDLEDAVVELAEMITEV